MRTTGEGSGGACHGKRLGVCDGVGKRWNRDALFSGNDRSAWRPVVAPTNGMASRSETIPLRWQNCRPPGGFAKPGGMSTEKLRGIAFDSQIPTCHSDHPGGGIPHTARRTGFDLAESRGPRRKEKCLVRRHCFLLAGTSDFHPALAIQDRPHDRFASNRRSRLGQVDAGNALGGWPRSPAPRCDATPVHKAETQSGNSKPGPQRQAGARRGTECFAVQPGTLRQDVNHSAEALVMVSFLNLAPRPVTIKAKAGLTPARLAC